MAILIKPSGAITTEETYLKGIQCINQSMKIYIPAEQTELPKNWAYLIMVCDTYNIWPKWVVQDFRAHNNRVTTLSQYKIYKYIYCYWDEYTLLLSVMVRLN